MIHSLEQMIRPERSRQVARRYQAAMPTGRYTTPEEIANMVVFLCSDLASNTTGGAIRRRRRPHRDRRRGDPGDGALSYRWRVLSR